MGSGRQSHCFFFTKTEAQTRIQGLSGEFLLVSVLTLKGIFTDHGDHGGHVQVSGLRACNLSDLDSGPGNSATDQLSNRSAG